MCNFFHDTEQRAACAMCGAQTHGVAHVALYVNVPVCGDCFLSDAFDWEHAEIGAPDPVHKRSVTV